MLDFVECCGLTVPFDGAGAESVVYEARYGGKSVAAKKPRLSTTDDMNRFHTELQILRSVMHSHMFSQRTGPSFSLRMLKILVNHGVMGCASASWTIQILLL